MCETILAIPSNPLQRLPGVMLVLLVAVFGVAAPGFMSAVANVVVQSTLLMLSLPMTFIIMTEGFHLSMGAVLTLERSRAFSGKIESGRIPKEARIRFKIPTGTGGPVMNGEAILRRPA